MNFKTIWLMAGVAMLASIGAYANDDDEDSANDVADASEETETKSSPTSINDRFGTGILNI